MPEMSGEKPVIMIASHRLICDVGKSIYNNLLELRHDQHGISQYQSD